MPESQYIELFDDALDRAENGEAIDVAIRKAADEFGIDLCGMMMEDIYLEIQSIIS
jgi:hypothetical protein